MMHVYYVVSAKTPAPAGTVNYRMTEVFRDEPIATWEQIEALAAWLDSFDNPEGFKHTVISFQLLRVQELAEAPPWA